MCAHCGAATENKPTGRKKRFCSSQCLDRFHHPRKRATPGCCTVCSTPIPNGRRCVDCRYRGGRKPDTPCASCGKMLWSGKGALPAGKRMCQPCRRITPQRADKPTGVCRLVVCQCGSAFTTRHLTRRWCSAVCRKSFSNRRPKADPAQRNVRNGRPYRRLRERVLAEESVCWICQVPFFGVWPMPLSPTMDHVVAISKGGAVMDRANVRAAHFRCNTSRNNRAVERPEVFAE